jgi:ABC-2 type transport system ATP-binding protein
MGDVRTPGDDDSTPAVVCDHLTRRFGDRTAVDDVSLVVDPGETYGLLGPNGAGKTTMIKMICGLLRPDAGSVAIAGLPQGPTRIEAKALVGYVPQDVALYPDLTAVENLRFFGRLHRLRGAELDERISEVLDLVGLTDRRDDTVDGFSGGMARRLNIAAGLLHRPSLLILDEPTVGVDPQSRHAILENVQELGRTGMAVLYTTHYMEEAQSLCDRIGIMDGGRLVAEGTHRELVGVVAERDRISLVARGDLPALATTLGAVDGVQEVSVVDDRLELLADDASSLLPTLIDAASAQGATIAGVEVAEPDLEAVFLHLTGTALRG